MSAMSDYLEGQIRAHIFRTATFTKPTVLAIALCTAATSDSQTGATITEVANSGSYARINLPPLDANWTAASGTDGITTNTAVINFVESTGAWGTITNFAICDSATWGAGNMLIHGTLAVSKVISSGDTFSIPAGSLSITFQ